MTSCDVAYCQTSIPRYMATWFAEIKENSDLYECAMKKKKKKKKHPIFTTGCISNLPLSNVLLSSRVISMTYPTCWLYSERSSCRATRAGSLGATSSRYTRSIH